MTFLYFTNRFIFQFFYIRLTRHTERIIDAVDLYECSMVFGGGFEMGGTIKKQHTEQWYSMQYWIVPFTGWSTDFKYLNKEAKYLKLTKNKTIV